MALYHVRLTHSSRKSLRKYGRSKLIDANVFNVLLVHLEQDKPLSVRFRDHKLAGIFDGFRECHIGFDVLVIYKRNEKEHLITISDIGTHDEVY